MYAVKDIANKIISMADEAEGDVMTNLKLQKLLYYMQGFHIAAFGSPLFENEIVAWQHGPVVPDIYSDFKDYHAGALPHSETIIQLTDDEENLFSEVYNVYGQYTASKLRNMTHEELPWSSTPINGIISKELMKEYFKDKITVTE